MSLVFLTMSKAFPMFFKRLIAMIFNMVLVSLLLSPAVLWSGRFLGIDIAGKGAEGTCSKVLTDYLDKAFPGTRLEREDEVSSRIVLGSRACGRVLETLPRSEHISGYGGPVPLAVILDADEHVKQVLALENSEDASYLRRLSRKGLWDAWNGLTPDEARMKHVDAVTGATFTSRAVIQSVRLGLGVPRTSLPDEEENDLLKIGAVIFCAGLSFAVSLGKRSSARWVALTVNLIVLGSLGVMVSSGLMLSGLSNGGWFGGSAAAGFLLAAALLITLFSGKGFYCAWLCPFGILQEMASRLSVRKLSLPDRVNVFLRWMRQGFFYGLLLLWSGGLGVWLSGYEPFSVFSAGASWGMLTCAGGILILGIFIKRPWCRFVCPTGFIFSQLERFPRMRTVSQSKECDICHSTES